MTRATLACLLLLVPTGCEGPAAGNADLRSGDLRVEPIDLAQVRDQAVPAGPDLAVPLDLAGRDMGLLREPDLAASIDLASPHDLSRAPDLSQPPDLSSPLDLSHPFDLAHPPDLADPCLGASCSPHASCASGGGGAACTCSAGYTGNGTTCATCTACGVGQVEAAPCTATVDRGCTDFSYVEHFDSGAPGFSFTSSSSTVVWHVSTASEVGPANNLRMTNPATGTYRDGSNRVFGTATTPTLFFVRNALLTFSYYKSTEGSTSWDQLFVDILDGNGAALATYPIVGDQANPVLQPLRFPVPYNASGVKVRFRFDTLDGFSNAFPGVYIDDLSIAPGDPCGNGSGAVYAYRDAGSGHCYLFVDTPMTQSAAESFCGTVGSTLVALGGASENATLTSLLIGVAPTTWIGASDVAVEGTFAWSSGEPFGYTNWAPGEPNDAGGNEDCGAITPSGTWNDLPCTTSLQSICELP